MDEIEKYNELVNKKLLLEENIIKIKAQIEEAKTNFMITGKFSDPVWFNKARYALEMNKLSLKKVNAEYELLKRNIRIAKENDKIKHTRTFERSFIDICKEVLQRDEYLKLVILAKGKIEKNNIHVKIKRKKWTLEEINYLIENNETLLIDEIVSHLGRSEAAIKRKLKSIKKDNEG